MTGAPLTLVVMALLMAVSAGGYGAAWAVHRLTKPSVGRGAWIATLLLSPLGAGFLFFPEWMFIPALWVCGVAVAVLREIYLMDRSSKCAHYEYRTEAPPPLKVYIPEWDHTVEVQILTDEERRRFLAEIDGHRGAQ